MEERASGDFQGLTEHKCSGLKANWESEDHQESPPGSGTSGVLQLEHAHKPMGQQKTWALKRKWVMGKRRGKMGWG